MLPQYKLRLSDGTLLVVDHDGLNTWLVDRKALVQAEGSTQWHPLHEFLAAERAAAKRAARNKPSTQGPLPLVPPPPKDEPIRKPEPARTAALPLVPPPPKNEPIRKPEPVRTDALPLIPPPPKNEPIRKPEPVTPSTPPAAVEPERHEALPLTPPPRLKETEWRPEPPSVGERPGVQVLAEEPAFRPSSPAPRAQTPDDSAPPIPLVPLEDLADDPFTPASRESTAAPTPDDSLAVIPLKPLDDRDRGPAHVWQGDEPEQEDASDEQGRLHPEIEEFLHHPAIATMLRAAAALGILLSKGLDAATRLERRRRPRHAATAATRSRLGALLSRGRDAAEHLKREWRSRRARPAASTGDEPVRPAEGRAAPEEAFGSSPVPVIGLKPRPTINPPPPIEALPALRLADIEEETEIEDIYEADDGARFLPVVWRWTKRLVVVSVLVGGGIVAAVTWQIWFPKAGELGQTALTEIDRQARSADLARARQRALQEGSEQLPQLAPDTIRLLLSKSPGGTLDAPGLLQAAQDAADRGLAALTSAEALELATLRREWLGGLDRAEREHVEQYERARAGGIVFPSEHGAVVALLARGARVLPPVRRERLQELLGRAIAAGLDVPGEAATSSSTPRSP